MKITTGAQFLDNFLNGGYEKGIITTIYGPSGCGKTNLALIAAVHVALSGKKVLFVDTEGGIAVDRIKQIASNYEMALNNFKFFQPLTFSEQNEMLNSLKDAVTDDVGLVIVDSIAMLYRLELGRNEEVFEVNSALGKQVACLVEIARRNKLPVILTNQVYSSFNNRGKVNMVGGDFLKYGSKCLIELQREDDVRKLVKKHRSLPENKEIEFDIVNSGISEKFS